MIKGIISNYNKTSASFSIEYNGVKTYFYLPNKLKETFKNSLQNGMRISFCTNEKTIIRRNIIMHEVEFLVSLSFINSLRPIYDIGKLNESVLEILLKNEYFLVLDLEISMAPFFEKNYIGEIIQAGFVLVSQTREIIEEVDYFLKTKTGVILNPKIFKFIRASKDEYFTKAVSYNVFYEKLKEILIKYNPKIVVWGNNDIISLDDSYNLYDLPALTNQYSFINLLNLHKNYYGQKEDLGLYAAYSIYYYVEESQDHDALHDAQITKEILFAFIDRLKK